MVKKPNIRSPLVAPNRNAQKQKKKSGSANNKNIKNKHNSITARIKNFIDNIISTIFNFIFKIFIWVFLRVSILMIVILGSSILYYFSILPDAKTLMDDRQKGSVTMLDAKGEVFAWRGDQFGGKVSSSTVSPYLKDAIIATEDKRFYSHWGISPRGILGAIRINIREGRKPWQGNGGSTITQQLAKRIYFEKKGNFERKIKEVPMSMAMELKYTKDEIFSIYLNRAFLGSGAYGFEAASQRYFSKSARDVNPAEAAMLAGLLKAPSAASPIRNLSRAQSRGNLIVGLMKDQGYLTDAQAIIAKNNPAMLSQTAVERAGEYFADWVLGTAPEFIIKDANADVIIETTFNKDIQFLTEQALDVVFQKLKPGSEVQAGVIVMSPDGAVRAMIGGRKTGLAGSFNRATQALRQTGSAFKPIVYAAALENGYQYNSILVDEPISIETRDGFYEPQNYSRTFDGKVSLTEALAKSTNTVAIKVSEEIGRSRVKAIANDFGIKSYVPLVPSMALGTGESTLLEMTGAYAGILNKGMSSIPYGLTSITIQGDNESLLKHDPNNSLRVINENAANQLTFMMKEVIKSGTGSRADLGDRQAAGKTGTTQGARDAWFIGFTSDFVVGVWMGYDDNRKLTGVTGSGMPADIWREVMLRINKNIPEKQIIFNEKKLANDLNSNNGIEFINRIFGGIGNKRKEDSNNDFISRLKDLFN